MGVGLATIGAVVGSSVGLCGWHRRERDDADPDSVDVQVCSLDIGVASKESSRYCAESRELIWFA